MYRVGTINILSKEVYITLLQVGPEDAVQSPKARQYGFTRSLLTRLHERYTKLGTEMIPGGGSGKKMPESPLVRQFTANLLTNYRCDASESSCPAKGVLSICDHLWLSFPQTFFVFRQTSSMSAPSLPELNTSCTRAPTVLLCLCVHRWLHQVLLPAIVQLNLLKLAGCWMWPLSSSTSGLNSGMNMGRRDLCVLWLEHLNR